MPFFLIFPNLFIIMLAHQGCTDNICNVNVWCVVCVPINCNLVSTLDFIEWHCTYLTHGQLFIHFLLLMIAHLKTGKTLPQGRKQQKKESCKKGIIKAVSEKAPPSVNLSLLVPGIILLQVSMWVRFAYYLI